MNIKQIFRTLPFLKESNCIVLGVTSDYMFAAANVILAVEKHSPCLIDKYVVYHTKEDPVSDSDKKVAKKLCKKIEFRQFDIGKDLPQDHPLYKRYSPLFFCRFSIFDLLNEFDNVLYLDADLVIQKDISRIFKYKPMAGRPTVKNIRDRVTNKDYFNFTDDDFSPNGGLLFVSRELPNYKTYRKECCQILSELIAINEPKFLDELTFGILNKRHNLGMKRLPRRFNCDCPWENSNEATIVHSINNDKFWDHLILKILFPQWSTLNAVWEKAGGSSYTGKVKWADHLGGTNREIIHSFQHYAFWSHFLTNFQVPKTLRLRYNLFKNYIILYIEGYDKDIHYELTRSKGKILVALHHERNMFNEYKLRIDEFNNSKYIKRKTKSGFSIETLVPTDLAQLTLENLMYETKKLL